MKGPWIFLVCTASLCAALGLGCSSSKPLTPGSTSSGAVGSSGGAPFDGSGGASNNAGATQCTPVPFQSKPAPVEIDEVDAKAVDLSGTAVRDLPVQVCGLDICVNGSTNAAGKTTVTPGEKLDRPAFKYGDGFQFAKLAALLGSEQKQNLGQVVALSLPDYSQGAAFPKSGDLTHGDLTLVLAPNGSVSHDLLTYTDDSELVFRSVQIPLSDSTQAADPKYGFELAYALAPVSTVFCPPAGLHLANSLGWAVGTAVEVFIQGLEVDQKWAPYADWVKVADASVSADGSSIESTSGGIPILSSVALRRK